MEPILPTHHTNINANESLALNESCLAMHVNSGGDSLLMVGVTDLPFQSGLEVPTIRSTPAKLMARNASILSCEKSNFTPVF